VGQLALTTLEGTGEGKRYQESWKTDCGLMTVVWDT